MHEWDPPFFKFLTSPPPMGGLYVLWGEGELKTKKMGGGLIRA